MESPAQSVSNANPRRFLPFVLILILGFLLGWGVSRFLPSPLSLQTPSAQIAEADLPIGLSILKNPVTNQWQGSAKGVLAAKSVDSMTIANKGATLVVPLKTGSQETVFFKRRSVIRPGDQPAGPISLEEIPIGSKIEGNFLVSSQDKDKIIGGTFYIVGD